MVNVNHKRSGGLRIGFWAVTLLLWIGVVDKRSVRVPTVTYVGGRFADMDLGGQSGHFGYGS